MSNAARAAVCPLLHPLIDPPLPPPRAHRAAAPLFPAARVNSRLPYMAVRALPPDLLPAPRADHLGGKIPVQGLVPLSGDVWVHRGQIIKAGEHSPPRAVGTAASVHGPGRRRCLVGMALFAGPPHLPAAVGGDGVGRCRAVACGMPLLGDIREHALQVVFSGDSDLARADRAARAVGGPGGHLRLPFMALLTDPPDLPVGPGGHIPRGQRAVFRWMPLLRQVRVGGGQVVVPRLDSPVGAHGTAAASCTGLDYSLPLMALPARPPDQLVAAGQELIGSKR